VTKKPGGQGKAKSAAVRPERTREHYIEALSRNYVERLILIQGHTVDEPKSDYGYDIVMTTFDYKGDVEFRSGELENGNVFLQLKATDGLTVSKRDGKTISFEIKRRHAIVWEAELMPVYLVIYSVSDAAAYWLHMQPYLKSADFILPPEAQEKVTVHLSKDQVLDEPAIEEFRRYKSKVVEHIAKELDDVYGTN
jgi:hypothetical protein